jgi:hypothetical protein
MGKPARVVRSPLPFDIVTTVPTHQNRYRHVLVQSHVLPMSRSPGESDGCSWILAHMFVWANQNEGFGVAWVKGQFLIAFTPFESPCETT